MFYLVINASVELLVIVIVGVAIKHFMIDQHKKKCGKLIYGIEKVTFYIE